MNSSSNKRNSFNTLAVLGLLFSFWLTPTYLAEEEVLEETEYVEINPVIITNIGNPAARKLSYVQVQAQLMVRGKTAVQQVELHMPLIRDFLLEFLGFSEAELITDVTRRSEMRQKAVEGINKILTENAGQAFVDDLLITHMLWR